MFISIYEVEAAAKSKLDKCAARFENAIAHPRRQGRHSIKYLAALLVAVLLFEIGLVLLGLLSPAGATTQLKSVDAVASVSDSKRGGNSAFDWNSPAVLMSRLPWLAPVGHRQPRRADVPEEEAVRAAKHAEHDLTKQPDSKLIICRCFGG